MPDDDSKLFNHSRALSIYDKAKHANDRPLSVNAVRPINHPTDIEGTHLLISAQ